ncbi:hypothetical protein RF11_04665 [Thelohanellus kitauei]|uniref:Uncharacterized protein n=1 Tax=Thelohanellus kitauei TaxID=669202 RepID=A0A0C2MT26_THEKT|nr:hypothetical protein RF11_04665 [Thelohanellus kitauei]
MKCNRKFNKFTGILKNLDEGFENISGKSNTAGFSKTEIVACIAGGDLEDLADGVYNPHDPNATEEAKGDPEDRRIDSENQWNVNPILDWLISKSSLEVFNKKSKNAAKLFSLTHASSIDTFAVICIAPKGNPNPEHNYFILYK